MTPPLSLVEAVEIVAIPNAWSMIDCCTHSPKEHEESWRPLAPKSVCKRDCLNAHVPPGAQSMMRAPERELIVEVRLVEGDA